MSLDEQYKLFDAAYASSCENIYEAVNNFAQDARSAQKEHNDKLSNSESLTYVLTKVLPDTFMLRSFVKDAPNRYAFRYVREVTSQIDDPDVRVSVIASMIFSFKQNNLTYKYLLNLSKSQRDRVKIICKMIWYNLYPEE